MNRLLDIAVRVTALLFLLSFPSHGMAQEPEAGFGLVCDKPDQLREIVTLANESRNFEASVEKVNNGTNACGMAQVVFLEHEAHGTLDTPEGKRDIVRITVIGVVMPHGVIPVTPLEQYTLFAKPGVDA